MIIIGFTAGGLAAGRYVLDALNKTWWFAYPQGYGSPLFVGWNIAHLTLRLRHPRPSLRRVFRQPGSAASLVGLASLVGWGVAFALIAILRRWDEAWQIMAYCSLSVGPAVLGSWLLIWLTGTARPEPGWIDRMGILIGVGWILLMTDLFANIVAT